MNNSQLLKWMISLTNKLCQAFNKFGPDSAEYQAVLDEIHDGAYKHNRRRRRHSWSDIAIIVFLLAVLAWLSYECASLLLF